MHVILQVRKAVHDMKKESTATRIKQIMKERQFRQVDILEKCKPFCQKFDIKLGRNDLSQYVNGKVEPGQEKLTILGMALNVSEAWLMGFDVPMERTTFTKESSPKIMQYYEQLNDIGKHEATKRVEELTMVPKYVKEDIEYVNAAHPINNASDEDKQFDEDIMDDEKF